MFKLNKTLASNVDVDAEDVLNAKQGLHRLGHYDPPGEEITDFTDSGLFDGLKSLQSAEGLQVDGAARPGGPTESAMDGLLTKANATGALKTPKKLLRTDDRLRPLGGSDYGAGLLHKTQAEPPKRQPTHVARRRAARQGRAGQKESLASRRGSHGRGSFRSWRRGVASSGGR